MASAQAGPWGMATRVGIEGRSAVRHLLLERDPSPKLMPDARFRLTPVPTERIGEIAGAKLSLRDEIFVYMRPLQTGRYTAQSSIYRSVNKAAVNHIFLDVNVVGEFVTAQGATMKAEVFKPG